MTCNLSFVDRDQAHLKFPQHSIMWAIVTSDQSIYFLNRDFKYSFSFRMDKRGNLNQKGWMFVLNKQF